VAFFLDLVAFWSLFLKRLTTGIRRSLGGGLFGGFFFSLKFWPPASGELLGGGLFWGFGCFIVFFPKNIDPWHQEKPFPVKELFFDPFA
jgi:hypothetical protein